jgi:soluble lytic murein transglycosylase-like protein
MDFSEPMIRRGYPPHSRTQKKNGPSLLCTLRKLSLFIVVFTLSFHFPNFIPGFQWGQTNREQTIKEIVEVLDKQPTDLANVIKEELAEVIYEEATRYNHDPKLILALIAIESEFYNWSVSEKGAKGLMQIMPYVAESLAREMGIEWSGDRTLFNPYLNIRIGIHYLSQLMLDFKDVGTALTAYNYGPTYVRGLIDRKERIPHNYSRRVLTAYKRI